MPTRYFRHGQTMIPISKRQIAFDVLQQSAIIALQTKFIILHLIFP